MTSSSSNLQLWKEYRIPLVCMAVGIATLSILLSNKNNAIVPKDKIKEDSKEDSKENVDSSATNEEKPRTHQGLKKADFKKLPKVIRKKPKQKKEEVSGCCGGKNKAEGDNSTGCCGGKNKPTNTNVEASHCACSATTSYAPQVIAIDPLALPELVEPMKIFYSTITGTAKLFAQQLHDSAINSGLPEPKIIDIVDYDTEDFLSETGLCVFILSTYNVEGPNDWFLKWLEDTRFDWRVEKGALSKLRFSVFGLGDSAYTEEFCNGPRSADKWLGQMGAQRVWPFGEGDKNGGMFLLSY